MQVNKIETVQQNQGASPDDEEKLYKVGPPVHTMWWDISTHRGKDELPSLGKEMLVMQPDEPFC